MAKNAKSQLGHLLKISRFTVSTASPPFINKSFDFSLFPISLLKFLHCYNFNIVASDNF
jgi:hypothetical protein